MKKWVLSFGPERAKALEEAQAIAETLQATEVIVDAAGNVHTDDVKPGTAHILLIWSTTSRTVAVDEAVSERMVLLLGKPDPKRLAEELQKQLALGSVLVESIGGSKLYPETAKDPDTVLVEYGSADEEVRTITFDFDSYYGWVKSSKFSAPIWRNK